MVWSFKYIALLYNSNFLQVLYFNNFSQSENPISSLKYFTNINKTMFTNIFFNYVKMNLLAKAGFCELSKSKTQTYFRSLNQ